MEDAIKKINVEQIMAEIRQDIEEKGYRDEDISFSDIPVHVSADEMVHSKAFRENVAFLRSHYNVMAYRPLKSNRIFGFLIVSLKKTIRKLIKFYIEPIVAEQNEINRVSMSCIQDVHLDTDVLYHRIEHLEDEIIKLKNKLKT